MAPKKMKIVINPFGMFKTTDTIIIGIEDEK